MNELMFYILAYASTKTGIIEMAVRELNRFEEVPIVKLILKKDKDKLLE